MLILDKYGYGYKAYKRGFDYDYNTSSKAFNDEIRCITYYLKKENKDIEYINKYIGSQLDKVYTFDKYIQVKKKWKLKVVENEINKEDSPIQFCKNEIDFIKKYPKNKGRIIFYIMCAYKLYGNNYIDITKSSLKLCYDNKIDSNTIDRILYELNKENIINAKLVYNKFNDNVKSVCIIDKSLIKLYDNKPIYSFSNLGNLSLLFDYITDCNNKVIFCEHCGKVEEKVKNNQKYCKECKVEINKEKTRQRMKNIRNNKMFDSKHC